MTDNQVRHMADMADLKAHAAIMERVSFNTCVLTRTAVYANMLWLVSQIKTHCGSLQEEDDG
jgi:hypothetical protein